MFGAKSTRIIFVAGLSVVVGLVACTQAWAWPFKKKKSPAEMKNAELKNLMSTPTRHINRKVVFECRFALMGNLFKHFNTQFNADEHANFAVWPMGTKLWDRAERRNVLPTLYIDKSSRKVFDTLRAAKRYQRFIVSGDVVSTYAGLPWLLVRDLKPVEECSTITETAIVHIRHGLTLIAAGKGRLAARHLEIALEDGTPPEQRAFVMRKLGESYAVAKMTDKAIDLYQQAISEGEKDPEMHLALGKLYLERDEADMAIAQCKETLGLSSAYPEAYAVMGEAYAKLGEFGKALENVELAENYPDVSPYDKSMALVSRARVLVAAERYADAVRAYAVAISGESELSGVAWLRKEIGALYENRFDATGQVALLNDAEREYANANVLSNNQDAEGLYLAARASFKRTTAEKGTVFEQARKFLADARKADPEYIPALLLSGEIYMAEGNTAEAEKIFTEISRLDGQNHDALISLAAAYDKLNQPQKALGVYERIIQADPTNRVGFEKHAALSERLGDLQGARDSYLSLTQIAPDNVSYHYHAGRLSLQLTDFSVAADQFGMASIAPGDMGQDAKLMRARALELGGMSAEAEQELRQLVAENSSNVKALTALTKLLADQNINPAEAVTYGESALVMDKTNPEVLDALAWAKIRAGNSAEALSLLKQIPQATYTRSVWYHLAVAQYYTGDTAASKEAAQNVLAPLAADEFKVEAEVLMERGRELMQLIDGSNQAPAVEVIAEPVAEMTSPEAQIEELFPVEEPVQEPVVMQPEEDDVTVDDQPLAVVTTDDEMMDIPGVVMPVEPNGIATLAGSKGQQNEVRNLPRHPLPASNVPVTSEEKATMNELSSLVDVEMSDPAASQLPPMPKAITYTKGQQAANAPVEIIQSEENDAAPAPVTRTPAIRMVPAGEASTAPAAKNDEPGLPRNDINALPDWAM